MIANKIMAMARGNLFVAVMYLFAITAFLSMWMSNTATAAMMLPLAMGILSKLDKEKEHNTYVFVLLGIAYSASIGGMGTLVGSPPNAIVASNLHLTFSDWLWYGLPIMLILMPLMIGTLFIVFKPKLHLHFEQNFERIEMNGQRVLTLVIFGVIALCWVFSSYINPIISGVFGLAKNIGSFDSVVALLAAVIICSTGVANWKQIQESTDWGVLMLFGGGLTLSSVLTQSGASKIMADGIVFIIEGGHYYVMALIVAAFIVCLTEFTSNTASAALLVPIFISIAQALNIPPLGFAMIIGLGACTDSKVNRIRFKDNDFAAIADFDMAQAAVQAAKEKGKQVRVGNLFSADLFYTPDFEMFDVMEKYGILGVEMEAAGIYGVAAEYGAKALCICTVSDHIRTHEQTTAEERQLTFNDMIEIALESVLIGDKA